MSGEKLRKLRMNRHLSVADLAREFNCSKQYIHKLEKAEGTLSGPMMQKYCNFFRVSADYFIDNESVAKIIPFFYLGSRAQQRNEMISLPASLFEEDRKYFAVSIRDTWVVICEQDNTLHYDQPGVFQYGDELFYARLEKYPDGSVWLISEEKKRPEPVQSAEELKSLGYMSYQLV